jgi:hypothetical protein
MTYSLRRVLLSTGVVLTSSAATFAAAGAIAMSGPAFAADKDYRFELVQAVSAGAGKSDVTVRLVRTADGTAVANAEISAATAIDTVAEPAGSRRFRVETATAGASTLQVSAKVLGPTRIERTFNSSIKATLERKVRGKDKVINGSVVFFAQ